MAARGISTDGGPPAWAVESCCLDGRVGLAKQQGKRVAHRLSKWPTDMEIDGISTGTEKLDCVYDDLYTTDARCCIFIVIKKQHNKLKKM